MSSQARKLGAALVLGFAGGVTAPIIVYLSLTHFGRSAHAAPTPPAHSLRLEIEPAQAPPTAPPAHRPHGK